MLFCTGRDPTFAQAEPKRLDKFLGVLARDLHDDSDPERDAWIRNSLGGAETKIRALDFILKRGLPEHSPSLLDVGAQIGSLSIYAMRFGIKSSAVDLPRFFQKFASAPLECGVDYRACDVTTEPLPFPDQSFDYVSYLDVIEDHPHSPKRVLEEIRRVLKPDGCVIISTPNQASIYNRFTLLGGGSISDPLDYFFEATAQMTPYPGHHRE